MQFKRNHGININNKTLGVVLRETPGSTGSGTAINLYNVQIEVRYLHCVKNL